MRGKNKAEYGIYIVTPKHDKVMAIVVVVVVAI